MDEVNEAVNEANEEDFYFYDAGEEDDLKTYMDAGFICCEQGYTE